MTTPPPADEPAVTASGAPIEEVHLDGLADRFMAALKARRNGQVDQAAELLRSILAAEPRLAEPHMELASIHLAVEQPELAVEHAREAVSLLEKGGQWTDDLPEHVVKSLSWNLLGESLKQVADQDSVVFGDAERWKTLMAEAKASFRRAAALDPDNQHASWSAFGFGPEEPEPDLPEDAEIDVAPLDLVDLVELEEGGAS